LANRVRTPSAIFRQIMMWVAATNYEVVLCVPGGDEVALNDDTCWGALPAIRHNEDLRVSFRPCAGRRLSRGTMHLLLQKLITHRNRGHSAIETPTRVISSRDTYAWYLFTEPIRGKAFVFKHEGFPRPNMPIITPGVHWRCQERGTGELAVEHLDERLQNMNLHVTL
jgi:hypothetical protein